MSLSVFLWIGTSRYVGGCFMVWIGITFYGFLVSIAANLHTAFLLKHTNYLFVCGRNSDTVCLQKRQENIHTDSLVSINKRMI